MRSMHVRTTLKGRIEKDFRRNTLNPTVKSIIKNSCKNFTENTTLHGLKYVGDDKKHSVERIWWIIMCILSIVTCGYLILGVWTKWHNFPVIISISETPTRIWQIPFPAVTVCPAMKSRQSVFNYTKYYYEDFSNLTWTERKYFDTVSLMCLQNEIRGNLTTDHSAIDIINEVAPNLSDTLIGCRWKGISINCEHIFSPIFTDEGLCFSFNMLEANELFRKEEMSRNNNDSIESSKKSGGWTLSNGYADHIPLDTYPHRGTGTGAIAGLILLLFGENKDLDYLCRGGEQGFLISLHTPAEIPRVSRNFISIPLNQEIIISVNPNIMTTSKGLVNYDPKTRHCYFPSERYLKYFKEYTQNNCVLECMTNCTAHMCGCVSFFMPRDPKVEICSTGSTACVAKVEESIMSSIELNIEVVDMMNNETDTKTVLQKETEQMASQCNCLPECTSFKYDSQISLAGLDWVQTMQALEGNESSQTDSISRVSIFLKESEFFTYARSELFTAEDMIASCGGLLSLCIGFSFLSLVELFYFFAWRVLGYLSFKRVRKVYKKLTKASTQLK